MRYLVLALIALVFVSVGNAQSSTFICSGPINTPVVEASYVELNAGCTGYIGELRMSHVTGDGLKVKNASTNAAHDIVIDGGYIECDFAPAGVHQDGVQVMGGARITFRNLSITGCRTDAFFVNKAGSGKTTPTDVVCESCYFGPGAAHTVNIGTSVRSGVRDSVACQDTTRRNGNIEFGSGAVNPVNVNNTQPTNC